MLVVGGRVFAGLLVLTGIAKLVRPTDTARAIRTLGVPGSLTLTYLLAVMEVSIGALVLVTLEPLWFALQAILYASFLLWVVWAIRTDAPLASCGCLGRDDTPPYWGHTLVNALGFAVSLLAATIANTEVVFGESFAVAAQLSVVVAGVLAAWVILGDGAHLHGRIHD